MPYPYMQLDLEGTYKGSSEIGPGCFSKGYRTLLLCTRSKDDPISMMHCTLPTPIVANLVLNTCIHRSYGRHIPISASARHHESWRAIPLHIQLQFQLVLSMKDEDKISRKVDGKVHTHLILLINALEHKQYPWRLLTLKPVSPGLK